MPPRGSFKRNRLGSTLCNRAGDRASSIDCRSLHRVHADHQRWHENDLECGFRACAFLGTGLHSKRRRGEAKPGKRPSIRGKHWPIGKPAWPSVPLIG